MTSAARPEPVPLVDRELRNPLFHWMMHLGVPLSVSIAVHVLLFAILALRSWKVFNNEYLPGDYEVEITDIAPDTREGLQWPGEHALEIDADAADLDPFQFDGMSDVSDAGLDELAQDDLLNPGNAGAGGFGLGVSGRGGVLGVGGGAGESGGGGFGKGFGTGSGLGRAQVWNLKAGGDKFAYVVDFSGSIIVAVDELKRELKRSIGMLTAEQRFAVYIFFSVGDEAHHFRTETFAPRLLNATPANKRNFFKWIDRQRPRGRTEPMQAMRRSLALEPDAVFFFSDGMFSDRVIRRVREANEAAAAQIHCLVFDELLLAETSGLPHMTDGARRLKRIADESGGKTKIVTGEDINKRP